MYVVIQKFSDTIDLLLNMNIINLIFIEFRTINSLRLYNTVFPGKNG